MLLESQSKPSYSPSPDVAQVLWIYLKNNQKHTIYKYPWHKVILTLNHYTFKVQPNIIATEQKLSNMLPPKWIGNKQES